MTIASRTDLKAYILRALGAPLVQIDITDESMEDVIDESLSFFQEYYFDGADRMFYSHQITATDIANKYIDMPDYIWGVNKVYPFSSTSGIAGADAFMFDVQFQLRQADMKSIVSGSLVYYHQMMSHLQMMENMLIKDVQYRFNRNIGKLFVDINWNNTVREDMYFMVDCYSALDPVTNTRFWDNRLFKEYVVAAANLKWSLAYRKFDNIVLPGGVTVDGKEMYQTAKAELEDMETDIITNQSPLIFITG